MTNTPMVTSEYLKSIMEYDAQTGLFYWRKRPDRNEGWNRLWAGKPSCSWPVRGYLQMEILGKRFYVHRLVWLYVTGSWPESQIDHINNDRTDNRLVNLRAATALQNSRNVKKRSHNTSGFKGVTWHKSSNKWLAKIRVNRKDKHLGVFGDPVSAAKAYADAAQKYHGEFGRPE